MGFIKKLIPTAFKDKIKRSLGLVEDIKITQITNEVAMRTIAREAAMNREVLKDKVVVVTGASGFIGKAIVKRMLTNGATVCACGRNVEKLQETYAEVSPEDITLVQLDLTKSESIMDACNTIVKTHGRIDVLVNCAGGSARDDWNYIYNQEESVIKEIVDTNLLGTLLCIKYMSEIMVNQNCGKIINISSTVGVGGKAGFSEYAAAKAGIIGATRSLAIELGKHSITVNCVTPGIVNRGKFSPDTLKSTINKNCLESIGTAEDIAYGVAFFASDEANFITGQNLIIDGGRSLGLKGD